MITFQSQILKQISESITLCSEFKPLTEDIQIQTFLNRNKHVNIITNKINLNSSIFIQNKFNANYIYTHYVLPLYKSFHFQDIKIQYTFSFTSNPNVYFVIDDFDQGLYQISLKEQPYNQINLWNSTLKYTYPSTSLKFIDDKYKDISWEETFNGARRALRFLDSPRSMLKEYFRWCGLLNCDAFLSLLKYSIRIVLPFFDKLKQTLHANIDVLPPECRYFFDIPTIAGYPKMENRLFNDDPIKWLSQNSVTIYDSSWWSRAFRLTYGQAVIQNPSHLLTLHEFAHNRWLWVTDGATRFSKLTVDGDTVKTKFGAAVSLTNVEIDLLLEQAISGRLNQKSLIGVFIKPDEKGYKRRLIANVPLGGYIIASYIRYLIESFVGSTPLFTKLSPTTDEIIDVADILKTKRLALPLDESAYDYNVTRESWLGFISFLEDTFINNTGVRYFRKYFEHAFWEFEGDRGKWIAGMPSGLALTSFLNSWMNYIKQGTITPGIINWAAGDDVLTFPYDQDVDMNEISQRYSNFGAVANPIKNWKSNRYAEYLKRFYSANGTSGYPARVWSSLMWAGTERFFLPSDRLPELFELFKQFFDRIGVKMDKRYVAKDLSRAISNKVPGFNQIQALKWMHAPRVHGGAGCLPYNNLTFTWEVEHIRHKKIENSLIRLPRFLEYNGKITLKIGTFKLTTKSYRCGKSFKLSRITTLNDWERRLNREDIDYHGPFQSLVMDVIPLPNVDFISTSLMSAIASKFFFNSYPNLHGSWNKIASRLVNASLALVDVATQYLAQHEILTFI